MKGFLYGFFLILYIICLCISFTDIKVNIHEQERPISVITSNKALEKDYKINCEPIKQIWRSFTNAVWYNQKIYASEAIGFFDYELSNKFKIISAAESHPKPDNIGFAWYFGNFIGWTILSVIFLCLIEIINDPLQLFD